jgi:hypothetical protein
MSKQKIKAIRSPRRLMALNYLTEAHINIGLAKTAISKGRKGSAIEYLKTARSLIQAAHMFRVSSEHILP